jgi:hypothetical protein
MSGASTKCEDPGDLPTKPISIESAEKEARKIADRIIENQAMVPEARITRELRLLVETMVYQSALSKLMPPSPEDKIASRLLAEGAIYEERAIPATMIVFDDAERAAFMKLSSRKLVASNNIGHCYLTSGGVSATYGRTGLIFNSVVAFYAKRAKELDL